MRIFVIIIAVLTIASMILAFNASMSMKTVSTEETKSSDEFTPFYLDEFDKVAEVDFDELVTILDEMKFSYQVNSTSNKSEFDLDIASELIDKYTQLRKTETINDAHKELAKFIKQKFSNKKERQMYEQFLIGIEFSAIEHQLN